MPEATATIETALRELLAEHGLEGGAADAPCARLIRDYPLVRRAGERAALLHLCEHGMEPEEAREAVLELLAFELLGRVPYDRVLAAVAERAQGRDPVGPCLRAARMRRQIASRVRIHEPRPLGARLLRFALSRLGGGR